MALDTPLALAARVAATASSNNLTIPRVAAIRADLILTASTAPTTLDVKVEHSEDGGTTWLSLGAFTQLGAVATGKQSLHIPAPHSGLVRATYTSVGTSYTFSVTFRWETTI